MRLPARNRAREPPARNRAHEPARKAPVLHGSTGAFLYASLHKIFCAVIFRTNGFGGLDLTQYLGAKPQQHEGHNNNEHTADEPFAQVNCGAGANPASSHIGASHGDSEEPVN